VPGERDQLVLVTAAGGGVRGQDGQEGAGEQGQDGPPVPGGPAADLVLVQGGEFLPASESVPDLPPGSCRVPDPLAAVPLVLACLAA
jgi:hypothetical protein